MTFSVPEDQLAAIRKSMAQGTLRRGSVVPSDTGEPARGQLSFIDNTVDSTTGAIKLKATFANQERKLWPGQFVNVVLTVGTGHPNATVVPSEADSDRPAGPVRFRGEGGSDGGECAW